MIKLVLLIALAFCCWPLALAAMVMLPLIWLVLLPFKLAFFALHIVFALLALPFKILKIAF
jgi:hypothetical protein